MIWFETHANSIDNEAGIASGQSDPPLSLTGIRQAAGIAARYPHINSIWCSDLQRSYRTAAIAFQNRAVLRQDRRLREIHFGQLTRSPSQAIEATRARYIDTPYPNGESYREVCRRVHSFLQELLASTVPHLIIGHRATWYALEHLMEGRELGDIVAQPGHWQPGWRYRAVFS